MPGGESAGDRHGVVQDCGICSAQNLDNHMSSLFNSFVCLGSPETEVWDSPDARSVFQTRVSREVQKAGHWPDLSVEVSSGCFADSWPARPRPDAVVLRCSVRNFAAAVMP